MRLGNISVGTVLVVAQPSVNKKERGARLARNLIYIKELNSPRLYLISIA